MHAFEEQLVIWLQQVFGTIGWGGVVALMAIESACIPLPSEVIMPLSGWMLVRDNFGLILAGFYGALGCTIGSAIAYEVGAIGGRPALMRYGRYVLVSKHDIELADRWFNKYGEAVVFFSRLLPVVRTFISFPAGVSKMNFARFLVYTFVGSFPWSLGLAWAGFIFGEHWRQIREFMRPFDIPIIIAVLLLVGIFVYRRVKELRLSGNPA